jgi:hypothetical protein
MMIFGGGAVAQAASNPSAARPLAPAPAGADQLAGGFHLASTDAESVTFGLCTYYNDWCITGDDGSGYQVYVVPYASATRFEWHDVSANLGFLYDEHSGLCLKDDPGVGNIVVELACTTNLSTTLAEEEEWSVEECTSATTCQGSGDIDNWTNKYSQLQLHLDPTPNSLGQLGVNTYGKPAAPTSETFEWSCPPDTDYVPPCQT